MAGEVQRSVDDQGMSDKVHLLGFLTHKKVDQILEQANLNVIASKDEGFGLSIIEGYSHGVPTVTFSDLDAVPDLFDNQAMVKVEGRSDDELATGIEEGLNKQWDRSWIREYAKSFSIAKMAEQYIKVYSQSLN